LGFIEDARIPPDYRYVKGITVDHKFNHRKNRYSEKYDISVMTETEIMKLEGWNRIYDCGKIRYVMDASE
jgi:hypothetical protein